MLSQSDLNAFRALDGKQQRFLLLNVDIHDHSKLLAKGDPHIISTFYRLAARFFVLAVELNHGFVAPWQGDGGFAIFRQEDKGAFENVWTAAADFLVPFQNSILRNLQRQCKPSISEDWQKDYPQYYCVIDSIDLVFDFNSPGIWCGCGLSHALKNFKKMAKPSMLAITKVAYELCRDENFWKSKELSPPTGQKIYYTKSLGPDLIISNPDYRDRIYKQQAENIAARNSLTEFVIENGFGPKQFLLTAIHCLANVFRALDDFKKGAFRISVWRNCGNRLKFAWGYPRPESFGMFREKGKKSWFLKGEGCAGKVWTTGEPIFAPEVKEEKSFMHKHDHHADESAAFFPVLPKEQKPNNYSPNQLLGVLCLSVTGESKFKFKPVDREIIETYVTPFSLNIGLALKLLEQEESEKNGV